MKEAQPIGRPPEASHTEFARILTRANMNGADRLFGGDLQSWMDDVAAVSARRHVGGPVTTACIEKLRFLRPARQNETLVIAGEVIYTGHTSLEVKVKAEVEYYDGNREAVADGIYILVALDENEKPRSVPPLLPHTDGQKALFNERAKKKLKIEN